ncbi:MAG: DUF2961 domain-containing protein [Vicinamibacteria bacterium]
MSSFDTTGGNGDNLRQEHRARAEADPVRREGRGHRHPHLGHHRPAAPALSRHDVILRMWWDGEAEPSVEAPIGDFFGQGWDECYPFVSMALSAGPRRARDGELLHDALREGRPHRDRERLREDDRPRSTTTSTTRSSRRCPPTWAASTPGTTTSSTQAARENEWSVLGPQAKNLDGARNYLFADVVGKDTSSA